MLGGERARGLRGARVTLGRSQVEPGAPSGRGAARRPGFLVSSSLRCSPETRGGWPVSSGSAHLQASHQNRAALPAVAYAGLHSFCSHILNRHRPL